MAPPCNSLSQRKIDLGLFLSTKQGATTRKTNKQPVMCCSMWYRTKYKQVDMHLYMETMPADCVETKGVLGAADVTLTPI